MDPSTILAAAAAGFFLIVAVFAAKTAHTAIALDERQQLPMLLFWSITKTVWIFGPLLFIGVIGFFLSDAPRGDTGGIMSRQMGVLVLAVGALLALALFWASAITLGFIAGAIARNLPIRVAAAVVFGTLLLSPLLCTGIAMSGKASQQRRSR